MCLPYLRTPLFTMRLAIAADPPRDVLFYRDGAGIGCEDSRIKCWGRDLSDFGCVCETEQMTVYGLPEVVR